MPIIIKVKFQRYILKVGTKLFPDKCKKIMHKEGGLYSWNQELVKRNLFAIKKVQNFFPKFFHNIFIYILSGASNPSTSIHVSNTFFVRTKRAM